MPRGSTNLSYSYLPSARLVSWELHHDRTFPLGDVDKLSSTLASDSTCALELRSSGCNNCETCTPRPCEFNQVCPNATDKTTAAKLGGNGALVTHMVLKRDFQLKAECNPLLKVMQFGQFVAHSFSMTAQTGDFSKLSNQIK